MNPRTSKKRNQAWTVIDLGVVITVIVLLAAMLLPVLGAAKRRSANMNCASNLKDINLALRIWEGGSVAYPMCVSVTNGGAMEMAATGNVAACFQIMSNQLGTPKILICPADLEHYIAATNFQNDFNNSHISYFINPDANESYPQMVMTGDANLAINGIPVKSGLVLLPSNAQVSWTPVRHGRVANIGYADGSVAEVSTASLQTSLILATNGTPNTIIRFAIP